VVLETAAGVRVAFVQIAGLIARRIICYPKAGDVLKRGARYGLIRFGSRVDVYLPAGVEPLVKLGDATVAGETILGRLG
jgi:phosphatidylserine decarboxylase